MAHRSAHRPEEIAVPMPRKILLAVVIALTAALTVPTLAAAKTQVSIGIGDQNPAMFDHKDFKRLKLKKARFFIHWNTMNDPAKLALAEAWVDQARKRKVRPFLHVDAHFEKARQLPSVRQYRRNVGKLVRHFRKRGVKEWGAWNEVNSPTQPTYRKPKRVAQFFLEMRKMCKGCTIVALDVLDSGKMRSYIQAFYKALGSKRRLVKIVGIHTYADTNRKRNNTRKLINWTKKYGKNRRVKFWITETGGLAFLRNDKKTTFKCNPKRQAKAVTKMFRVARRHRRDVKRVYSYNFYGTGVGTRRGRQCDRSLRFDAGLMKDREGRIRRPAYNAYRKGLKKFIK